jgi:hypothetical protein
MSGQLHAPAALPPGKEPPVPNGYEAGWAAEPVWNSWRGEKSCPYTDSNLDPSAIQPVAVPTALSRLPQKRAVAKQNGGNSDSALLYVTVWRNARETGDTGRPWFVVKEST